MLILIFCIWGYGVAIATILKNYYRASADLKLMLRTYLVCPTIPVLAQATALHFGGFNSFLVITAFASITTTAYLLINLRTRAVDIWYHLYATLRSVRSATTMLFINSLLIFLTFSVDRIILNAYSSKDVVGEYSVILFAFAMLLIIPSTLAEFIFPKIVRSTVEGGRKFYPQEMLITLIPTTLAVMAAYFLAPYLINKFTPYHHLVEQIQLVTLGIIPYAVTPILFHVMSALDMRVQLVSSACVVLCLYTLALLWGATNADSKLEFFTLTRVLYGYALIGVYWLCLTRHQRRLV